jgi:hypothetical protein
LDVNRRLAATQIRRVGTYLGAASQAREALFHSQLHSFTAMAFGKDPNQVTEGEIASFLRVFVFLPAILVALASTLLAITAVHRIRPKKETAPVAVPDEAVIQIPRAAVQSANAELHDATTAAATTFGRSYDMRQKRKIRTEFSSDNIGPEPTKSDEAPESAVTENIGADVVQLRR